MNNKERLDFAIVYLEDHLTLIKALRTLRNKGVITDDYAKDRSFESTASVGDTLSLILRGEDRVPF